MYVFAALYMRRVEAGTWCQYVYIPVYVFMYLFRLKRHPSREMENSSEAHLCKQAACDMLMRSRVQRDLFMTSPDLAKTNNRSVGEFPGSFVMYIQRTAVVRTYVCVYVCVTLYYKCVRQGSYPRRDPGPKRAGAPMSPILLLRGIIVNRTCGMDKNL